MRQGKTVVNKVTIGRLLFDVVCGFILKAVALSKNFSFSFDCP